MKAHYIYFAIGALAILACSRNNEIPEPDGMQMTIRAYQEGSNMTRTTLQNGGTVVYWDPSDEIKVFFRGSSGRFVSLNTEEVEVTDFSGTINVLAGSGETSSSSNEIWGLYPYRADATFDGSSVTTTLPATQTGRAGSFAKNTNISLAHSGGLDLAFFNVCGGLRFSLTQEGIKSVTFEGNNDEPVAGRIKVEFENGAPAVKEVADAEKVITLTAPGDGTFNTGQWYYIEAIPGTLSKGYKLTFKKESSSATFTSSGSVTIKRGIFGSLSNVDDGAVFSDNGGHEPNPDDVIQFKDLIAKSACIEKYDTNGDGEISYAEAAAVTSLEGLFNDWNTVVTFDELRYFKSVTSTEKVFTGLPKLKHITIPDNITTLGTFQNCLALETVQLPAALKSLPVYCFDGCPALKSVTLPTGISSIPGYCFRNCSSLKTLAVPSSLTSIEYYAFYGCTALIGIDLPSEFKTIGDYAFYNCSALTNVAFPASLTKIAYCAFSWCTALESVVVGTGVTIDESAFRYCRALTTATIGENATLSSYAFAGCTNLYSVLLSSGVSVGQSAFSDCSTLASVVLPEDLTSLPSYCFSRCTSLASITWPRNLTSIGDNVFELCRFEGCEFSLQLPPSVTTIGHKAFGAIRHLVLPSAAIMSIEYDSFYDRYTYLYVPDHMVDLYKLRTNWTYYADRIRPLSDYPIANVSAGGAVGQVVDLGLSVKWSSWNVGASAPEDMGAYFGWGETESKNSYEWSNYLWGKNSFDYTLYNSRSNYGVVDGKSMLELVDDAAHINWGGTWRIPTQAEFQELCNNCKSVWTTENGVRGRRFTSKKEGYTDKSIFLPASGYRVQTSGNYVGSEGYYWSSLLNAYSPDYSTCAFRLSFDSSSVKWTGTSSRSVGLPIRPVCE